MEIVITHKIYHTDARVSVFDKCVGKSPCYYCHNEHGDKNKCVSECTAVKLFAAGKKYSSEDRLAVDAFKKIVAGDIIRQSCDNGKHFQYQPLTKNQRTQRARQAAKRLGYDGINDAIAKMRTEGLAFKDIGAKIMLSADAACKRCVRRTPRVAPRSNAVREFRKKCIAAYKTGKTVAQIAKDSSRPRSTIAGYINVHRRSERLLEVSVRRSNENIV